MTTLKEILSITGKPGLYKLVARTRNGVLVEGIADGKRFPVMASQNVSSLGDIAMYTSEDEVPLRAIFSSILQKENGPVALDPKKANGAEVESYFSQIVPNYDRERVYTSDMRKALGWYNVLYQNGLLTEELLAEKVEEEQTAAE